MRLLSVMIDGAEPAIIEGLTLPSMTKYGLKTYLVNIANTGPQMASLLWGVPPSVHTSLLSTARKYEWMASLWHRRSFRKAIYLS